MLLDGARPTLVPQRNPKKFTSMNSGAGCPLASAATGQATRGATQDGHPAPRPARRGSGHQWGGPCEHSRALRDPEGARPQDPTGQLRGVLARVPREPGRSRGPGSRGPDAPRSSACARACSPAMAVTDGAPLHLSEPAAAASRTSSRPRAAQARRVSPDPTAGPPAPGPARPADSCRLASGSSSEVLAELSGESQKRGGFWRARPRPEPRPAGRSCRGPSWLGCCRPSA